MDSFHVPHKTLSSVIVRPIPEINIIEQMNTRVCRVVLYIVNIVYSSVKIKYFNISERSAEVMVSGTGDYDFQGLQCLKEGGNHQIELLVFL